MINEEVFDAIDRSVLCWLATTNKAGVPNVSPKEVFAAVDERTLIIANIASPVSVRNIQDNANVSLAFIDVFLQKGFKLGGQARVVESADPDYYNHRQCLEKMTGGRFHIHNIIEIEVQAVSRISAPSYSSSRDATETNQVKEAILTYGAKLMKTARRLPD